MCIQLFQLQLDIQDQLCFTLFTKLPADGKVKNFFGVFSLRVSVVHAYDGSGSLKATHFPKLSFQTGFKREEEELGMNYLARIVVNPISNTADTCLLSFSFN